MSGGVHRRRLRLLMVVGSTCRSCRCRAIQITSIPAINMLIHELVPLACFQEGLRALSVAKYCSTWWWWSRVIFHLLLRHREFSHTWNLLLDHPVYLTTEYMRTVDIGLLSVDSISHIYQRYTAHPLLFLVTTRVYLISPNLFTNETSSFYKQQQQISDV